MELRNATAADAPAMSDVLNDIFRAKLRSQPAEPALVLARWIEHKQRLACTVAVDELGVVLGFQSLKRSWVGNEYDVPEGWGIIGTHISPRAARRGVGAALFAVTRQAAQAAALTMVDATIGETNAAGLAYYEAMGFRTYRRFEDCICKRYQVP